MFSRTIETNCETNLSEIGWCGLDPFLEAIDYQFIDKRKSKMIVVGLNSTYLEESFVFVYRYNLEKNRMTDKHNTRMSRLLLPGFGCFDDEVVFMNNQGKICRLSLKNLS